MNALHFCAGPRTLARVPNAPRSGARSSACCKTWAWVPIGEAGKGGGECVRAPRTSACLQLFERAARHTHTSAHAAVDANKCIAHSLDERLGHGQGQRPGVCLGGSERGWKQGAFGGRRVARRTHSSPCALRRPTQCAHLRRVPKPPTRMAARTIV